MKKTKKCKQRPAQCLDDIQLRKLCIGDCEDRSKYRLVMDCTSGSEASDGLIPERGIVPQAKERSAR